MAKYAVIENEKVVNTVLAEADVALERGWVLCPDQVGIGWDYSNNQFVDNRPAPEIITPPALTKEQLLAQLQTLQAQIQALT
jgi:hypothetical protein